MVSAFLEPRPMFSARCAGHSRLGWGRSLAVVCLAVFAFIMLSGCVSSSRSSELSSTLSKPAPASLILFNEELRISPLDMVDVNVFGASELSQSYQIDFQGNLKMPLVGIIKAQGLSPFELADEVEGRLAANYMQDPDVSVLLETSDTSRVTVDGAVRKPGLYAVRSDSTLLQALAMSGGPTELADLERVVVLRGAGDKRQIAGFDITQIRSGEVVDPRIYGDDIIIVDGSDSKAGYREFLRSLPLLSFFVLL